MKMRTWRRWRSLWRNDQSDITSGTDLLRYLQCELSTIHNVNHSQAHANSSLRLAINWSQWLLIEIGKSYPGLAICKKKREIISLILGMLCAIMLATTCIAVHNDQVTTLWRIWTLALMRIVALQYEALLIWFIIVGWKFTLNFTRVSNQFWVKIAHLILWDGCGFQRWKDNYGTDIWV